MLEKDGLLELDDPVRKYLPQVPPGWDGITIRSLLNHTSGLPDDWELHDDWSSKVQFFLTTTSTDEFLQSLMKHPLLFKSGSEWRYSCGPFVAGLVIEQLTGRSYAEFMKDRVFDPLAMDSTSIGDPSRLIPHRVTGYLGKGMDLRHGYRISSAAHNRGDVGALTTARDMVRWINALRDGSLLGHDGTAQMFSTAVVGDNTRTPSGLGWFVVPIHGTQTIGHEGLFRTGFSSSIGWYPNEDLVAIILTNQGNGGSVFQFAQRILGCIDQRLAPHSTRVGKQDSDPERTRRLTGAVRAAGTGEKHPLLLSTFPYLFHAVSTRRRIASTTSIEFINNEVLAPGMLNVHGHEIHELLFCKVNADNDFFTTLYLDEVGRILFLDWPE